MAQLAPELQHTAEVFARVSTLAQAIGVDAAPLLDACAVLDVAPARFCRVAVSGDLDSLSVWCRWPERSDTSAAVLADIAKRDRLQGERAEKLLARADSTLYVEYGLSAPGAVGTAVHAFGLSAVDDDVALLGSIAHVGDAIDRLRGLANVLGDRSVGLSDRYEPVGHHSWSLYAPLLARTRADHVATVERVDRVCEMLGVTMPQRVLIRDLHSVLAKTQTTMASLRVGPGVTFPELTIVYRSVRFESVIRVLQGLSMGSQSGADGAQTGAGIGKIAGALGSDVAHAMELTLRNEEPPGLRVAVDMEMGQPCRR